MAREQEADTEEQPGAVIDIPTDAPPASIEVDVDSGDVEEQGTPPAAAPQRAKPDHKQRQRDRVRTLARERDAERTERQRLEQELQQSRQQAADARQREESATTAGMESYAERVKSELSSARDAMKTAMAANDADALVAAQEKLARAASAQGDVDAWQSSRPKPGERQPQQQQPQPERQPQQQPQQEIIPSEPTLEFFSDNPWFDAVQRNTDGSILRDQRGTPVGNPDFDEDMHDAAMIVHKRILREIRQGRKPTDYVETPEYFDEIGNEMRAQFPDVYEDGAAPAAPQPQRRTPPMSQARQPVAPAARPSAPGTAPRQQNKIVLTGEERGLVDGLVQNGAMRYPTGHKMAGEPMEPKDAYVEYARQAKLTRTTAGQQ